LVAVLTATASLGYADDLEDRYFGSGPFARAQRALVAGDTNGAIAKLSFLLKEDPDAASATQARYLLGLALIKVERYEEAIQIFGELVSSYPVLKDDHLYYRGVALYKWGSKVEAARVLAQVNPLGPRGKPARRLRGRALFESTDFETLRSWLEPILEREGRLPRELLFYLGHARHRTGDPFAAFRAFREVWRENPRSSFSGRALAQLAHIRLDGESLMSKKEREFILLLENELRSGATAGRALSKLEKKLEKLSSGQRLRSEVAYARGRLAEIRGRHYAAIVHYKRAQATAPIDFVEIRILGALAQGRVHRILGQDLAASKLFAMAADRFPNRPESEEALFRAGETLLALRKHAEAEKRFEGLLLRNPVTPFRARCQWGLAWGRFRQGKYEEAKPFFSSLTRMKLSEDLHAASRYWLGRTEASLGNLNEARIQLLKLVEERPLSFYSALASDLLAQVEPGTVSLAAAAAHKVVVQKEVLPVALVRVKELIRLGLRARARKALSRFDSDARRSNRRLSAIVLRTMADCYEALNQSLQARYTREEFAREYPGTLSLNEVAAAARQAHPLKFAREIRSAARRFAIPEFLLFALIRTESNFRPDAVSSQNAYGLAQLILPTAKAVGRRLGVRQITPTRLRRNPGLNVRLGAYYLKSLLDKFDGSEVLALAAYNAGPGAVGSWMMNRVRRLEGQGRRVSGIGLTPSPDELVEEIPVTETKTYVRKVLARQRAYERLYRVPVRQETVLPVEDVPLSVLWEPRVMVKLDTIIIEPEYGHQVLVR